MSLAFKSLAAAAAAVALVACNRDDSVANDPANVAGEAANTAVEAPPPSEQGNSTVNGPPANAINEADDSGSEQPSPPGTPEAQMIPGQYRGRWGMNLADCERSRSDAKGAITIGERTVAFYESRATLKQRRPAIATSFSGLFAFTGEGHNWEKVMTFTRTGDELLRAEADGRYNYRRCR